MHVITEISFSQDLGHVCFQPYLTVPMVSLLQTQLQIAEPLNQLVQMAFLIIYLPLLVFRILVWLPPTSQILSLLLVSLIFTHPMVPLIFILLLASLIFTLPQAPLIFILLLVSLIFYLLLASQIQLRQAQKLERPLIQFPHRYLPPSPLQGSLPP